MADHFVAHHGSGYRVYRLVNGLYRQFIGPIFATPKEAARYADKLRASAESSTTDRGAPVPGSAGLDDSADVPRGSSAGLGGPVPIVRRPFRKPLKG